MNYARTRARECVCACVCVCVYLRVDMCVDVRVPPVAAVGQSIDNQSINQSVNYYQSRIAVCISHICYIHKSRGEGLGGGNRLPAIRPDKAGQGRTRPDKAGRSWDSGLANLLYKIVLDATRVPGVDQAGQGRTRPDGVGNLALQICYF